MIDFRYHIVSLISVFLALAIGIVLGAGPLKDAIGDQLTGQVEALRTGKEELRVALTEAEANLGHRDAFLEGVSADLLAGTLPGRRVALIELDEPQDDVVDALTTQLAAAGASVTARVQLDESWTNDSKATFRQSLASSLTSYLDPEPAEQSTEADLATALIQSLTSIEPGDENSPSAAAADIRSLLAASDLVTFDDVEALPADMIVFVSNPPEINGDEENAESVDLRATTVHLQTLLAQAAAGQAEASVVVSVAEDVNDLLQQVTATGELSASISTVARGHELPGQLNVPLALAARAIGTVGQYGDQENSTGSVPAITRLGAVDRTNRFATVEELPDASNTEDGADSETDADAESEAETDGEDQA